MTFIQQEKSYNGKQISNNNIAVQCISNHQWLDALVLLEQEASLNQIVCYNLALCYLQAREYEKALDKLNQAVSEVRMNYSKLILSERLLLEEQNSDVYLKGMVLEIADYLPQLVNDRIQRVYFDLYLLMKDYPRAVQLGKKLEQRQYKNVVEGMKLIESGNQNELV